MQDWACQQGWKSNRAANTHNLPPGANMHIQCPMRANPPNQPLPQACLVLVEKRETRYRVQWYYKLFEQTMRGLARDARRCVGPLNPERS